MAMKGMTIKEAIAKWEKDKGETATEALTIELQFQWPPIEKMDGALSTLTNCEKLSLSSNMIDKIAGIAGMRNLKVLSLGRNYIKSLAGVETVADSLTELWISYNLIDKFKGIGTLKNLKVFYCSNNLIKEWAEFNRLQECPALRDLVMIGNPLVESQPDVDTWRTQASNRLQQITKLDGIPIIRD
ncbi:dynein light chain 1, axonemal-like [Hyposmocoma kahamanoa]|uniref:dynein light chain 1, axonemal-like n=1 Tax=Hyposmocoma kahamanoa TaxID=1477025 RepID=UPI000E6D6ABB|nr:dynein light chain 1, axonemal-like [Hyposmocoma kahamanoa]